MKAYINFSTYRKPTDPHFQTQPVHSICTQTAEVKEAPLWWQEKGLSFTATGYGSRIPSRYMIKVSGKWRRVYVRCYSNNGTTYIGKLSEYGERAIVNFED